MVSAGVSTFPDQSCPRQGLRVKFEPFSVCGLDRPLCSEEGKALNSDSPSAREGSSMFSSVGETYPFFLLKEKYPIKRSYKTTDIIILQVG